jgi:D-aminopeptidase
MKLGSTFWHAMFTLLIIELSTLSLIANASGDDIRARDLGIPFTGQPGKFNAITDVKGVEVGHATIINGQGDLVVGKGPVRTGVTAILPRGKKYDAVFSAWYTLNGNGDMFGTTWVEESGILEAPILITNTFSAGLVRDATVQWMQNHHFYDPIFADNWITYPLVGETYDGLLNDIMGQHVKQEHVFRALNNTKGGRVIEGNIGGGTAMVCHEFKCGIGTASRLLTKKLGGYTVGVLVQANHGTKDELTIAGISMASELAHLPNNTFNFSPASPKKELGSIIVVVATDAPLLPHQLKRLLKRVPIGIGKVGGSGGNGSGDIFVAFSTANINAGKRTGIQSISMMPNDEIDPLFSATIQATEEAIMNALIAGKTMEGINGNTVYALEHKTVLNALKKFKR